MYLHKQIAKVENLNDALKLGQEIQNQERAIAQASAVENYSDWQAAPKQESDPWRPDQALTLTLFRPLETYAADVVQEWATTPSQTDRSKTRLQATEHGLTDLARIVQAEACRRAGIPVAALAEPLTSLHQIEAEILAARQPRREDADVEDDERPPKEVVDAMDLAYSSNTDYMYAQAERGHWASMIDIDGAKLPGAAEKYSTCGLVRFMACPYDSYAKRIRHNCGRLSCPICVRGAGAKIAAKLARRLWLYRCMIQQETKGKKNPYPSHVIESIPGNSPFWKWSKSKQNRILSDCRKIAGLSGGVSVSHLWRFTRDGKKTPRYSPHNHLLTHGWVSDTAYADILAKHGIKVLYHKVAKGTMETQDDVFRVAMYLLSHCEVKARQHSYKWFGDLSYTKINNETLEQYIDLEMAARDQEIEKSKSCRECGAEMKPARIKPECLHRHKEYPHPQDQDKGTVWPSGFIEVIDLRYTRLTCYTETWEEELVKTRKEEIELREDANRKRKQEAVAAVAGQQQLA